MKGKGLCITCVHDKSCIFTKSPPVLQCEEFNDYESVKTMPVKTKAAVRQKKTQSDEEETESSE